MTDQNPYSTPEADLTTAENIRYSPKLISTKGRIGRLRFFAYSLASQFVLLPLFGILFAVFGFEMQGKPPIGFMIGMGFIYILIFAASIIIGRRRIHDLNRSSWWLLLFIIPLLNLGIGLYLMLFKGTEGDNDYGPAPIANSTGVKVLGMLLPAIFLIGILAAIALPAYQEFSKRAELVQ